MPEAVRGSRAHRERASARRSGWDPFSPLGGSHGVQDTKTLAHKIYTPLKYYTADFNILPCFGKCTIFTQTPRLSINAISLGLAQLGNVRHYFTV